MFPVPICSPYRPLRQKSFRASRTGPNPFTRLRLNIVNKNAFTTNIPQQLGIRGQEGLPPSAWDDWLGHWPDRHAERLATQVAGAEGNFEYYPVDRYVNSTRNQGERCIELAIPAGGAGLPA